MKNIDLIRKIICYADLESDRDDPDTIHETVTRDIVFHGKK